jgi:hypothetical protein
MLLVIKEIKVFLISPVTVKKKGRKPGTKQKKNKDF